MLIGGKRSDSDNDSESNNADDIDEWIAINTNIHQIRSHTTLICVHQCTPQSFTWLGYGGFSRCRRTDGYTLQCNVQNMLHIQHERGFGCWLVNQKMIQKSFFVPKILPHSTKNECKWLLANPDAYTISGSNKGRYKHIYDWYISIALPIDNHLRSLNGDIFPECHISFFPFLLSFVVCAFLWSALLCLLLFHCSSLVRKEFTVQGNVVLLLHRPCQMLMLHHIEQLQQCVCMGYVGHKFTTTRFISSQYSVTLPFVCSFSIQFFCVLHPIHYRFV